MKVTAPYGEVCRYLGYKKGIQPDPETEKLIRACTARVEQAADPRTVSTVLPLTFEEGNGLELGPIRVKSAALGKNLRGCEEIILFAATLGLEVDRLIARAGAGRVTEGAIYQAAGAALIEEVCDQANDALRAESEAEGWYLRPRFSPGYGDFPITCQPEIARLLRTPERIGLTVTDSMLLVPVKSVTAVIGRSRQAVPCHRQGCEACGKLDCAFRRD